MTTPTLPTAHRVSRKASLFTESVIREMTREAYKYEAINLAQGFPDFPPPPEIIAAAHRALRGRGSSPRSEHGTARGARA